MARTDGGLALAPGTEVTVTARGPVLAWPDDQTAPDPTRWRPHPSAGGQLGAPEGIVSTVAPAGIEKSLAGGEPE